MIKKISPLPEFLIERYNNWRSTLYSNNIKKFNKLAIQGQNPYSMVISCCDSRVHVTSIFGSDEGEIFIHRNIANLVPPYSPNEIYDSTAAAIEYATKELKIRHLIILGHTGCGGIKTSYLIHKKKLNRNYTFIDKWLSIIQPAHNSIAKSFSEEDQIEQLGEESVKNSLNNLFSFPDIKLLVENNNLSIHGLIHDIGSGRLKYLDPITQTFQNV